MHKEHAMSGWVWAGNRSTNQGAKACGRGGGDHLTSNVHGSLDLHLSFLFRFSTSTTIHNIEDIDKLDRASRPKITPVRPCKSAPFK